MPEAVSEEEPILTLDIDAELERTRRQRIELQRAEKERDAIVRSRHAARDETEARDHELALRLQAASDASDESDRKARSAPKRIPSIATGKGADTQPPPSPTFAAAAKPPKSVVSLRHERAIAEANEINETPPDVLAHPDIPTERVVPPVPVIAKKPPPDDDDDDDDAGSDVLNGMCSDIV